MHYTIESGDRLVLDINEGPLVTLGLVNFIGNDHEPADKFFDYAVGPTRERYSKLQKNLPFVAADIEEGADLVHRLYIAEGFLDSMVDPPHYVYVGDGTQVDVTIADPRRPAIFFRPRHFRRADNLWRARRCSGKCSIFSSKPYTDARLADIPRRLQAYFKSARLLRCESRRDRRPGCGARWAGAGADLDCSPGRFTILTA